MSYVADFRRSLPGRPARGLAALVLAACALLLGTDVLAQSSQISNLNDVCGADVQGQDYGNCTAGEIALSDLVNVQFQGNPTNCVIGQPLTVSSATVNYQMNTNTRYDLLMWFGDQEGTDPRLASGGGKTCSVWSVPGPFNPTPDATNPWGTADGDQCGDIVATVTQTSRTFSNLSVTCQDNNNNGLADINVLLTWSQNTQQACGEGTGQSFPTVGSVSKCDYTAAVDTGLQIVEPPVLTLVKQVTNNSGGTALASAWTLTATGPQVISGTTGSGAVTNQTVQAGTYTLTESGPSGYTGTWNCTGGGTFQGPNQITLANAFPAQDVTCTLTNDDNPATLTLVKSVTNNNGGTAVAGDWTLTATGPTTITGASGSGAVTSQSVPAGDYTLTESGPSGYSAGSWQCTAGSLNGNVLTLSLGQTATCTITNDDQAANLTLTKIVTNDDGGNAQVSDWTLSADATNFTSGQQQSIDAGTYTLSESGPSGYTAGSWQCTGGSFTAPDQLTLTNGQTASCSITNNDDAPGLTLVKSVTNDNGGNDAANSFNLTLTGTDGTHDAGVDYSTGATPTVDSNVSYTVSETPNSGYTLTNITCVDDDTQSQIGQGQSVQFSLNEGQNVTCTFANDDDAPSLTVVKVVNNTFGGNAQPGDFDLRVTDDQMGACGQDGTTSYSSGNSVTPVQSNCSYTLSEQPFSGYTSAGVTCVDDDTQNSVSHPVSLQEGQNVTCTITNNQLNTGSITLIKNVTNDNGGQAVAGDFTLHITGDDGDSGDCGEDGTTDYSSGDEINSTPQNGCTYTVSEDSLTGYTMGTISCVDADDNNANVGHPFTFQNGQSIVCTVNNDDDGAMLALTKIVTNDSGGTATATDWTLIANGPTPQQGAGGFTSTAVDAGQYTLSETGGPSGYTAGSWNCGNAQGQLSDNVLTLNNGDDVTCTITNDDQQANLTLTKIVTNDDGGTAQVSDWTLSADATNFTSGQQQQIDAGTYTLSESGPSGYTAGSWQCTGGSFSAPNQLTLTPGQTASCSITNDDGAPMLTLIKDVTNDDGGTAVPASFTLTLQGADGTHDSAQQYSSGATPTVKSNVSYTVGETDLDGYSNQGVSCVDTGNANAPVAHPVTLSVGQTVTCTVSNDDIAPTLTLTKVVVNDNDGQLTAQDFTLTLTGADGTHDSGAGYQTGATPTIEANVSYTVSEDPPDGYDVDSIVCTDTDTQQTLPNPFTPVLDQDIACVVTNDDSADLARFRVSKIYSDGNTAEVEVFISCQTGLPLDQSKVISPGDDVTFVVRDFDSGELDCEVFESPVPTGYVPEYSAGNDGDGVAGAIFTTDDGCEFQEVEGGHFYCEIYNELQPVEVTVYKQWFGDFEENGFDKVADADYTCYNVRSGPKAPTGNVSGNLSFSGDSSDVIALLPDFDGSTYCTVDEVDVDSAVEADASDCAHVAAAPGQGNSCTINNVLFFEGIPALNRYGLALLALLMLGVGFVGFRRLF